MGEARLSSLPRVLLIFACFILITIAPILRMTQSPGDARPYWMFFLSHAWYLFLAALILRFEDKFKKRSAIEKSRRHAWEVRKSKAAQVVSQLQLKAPKTSKRGFRQAVLECVATSVSSCSIDHLSRFMRIYWISNRPHGSNGGRRTNRSPQALASNVSGGRRLRPGTCHPKSIAWIEDDVKNDPRWQDLEAIVSIDHFDSRYPDRFGVRNPNYRLYRPVRLRAQQARHRVSGPTLYRPLGFDLRR